MDTLPRTPKTTEAAGKEGILWTHFLLSEVSSAQCHGRRRPRGGSVRPEMCLRAAEAIPRKALLGRSWPAEPRAADQILKRPTQKWGSLAAPPPRSLE